MALKQFARSLKNLAVSTAFRQSRMRETHEIAIGGCAKNAIWWSASFKTQVVFEESPHAMRNSPNVFLPSFSLVALYFGWHDMHAYAFTNTP